LASKVKVARQMLQTALDDGTAAERFSRMVAMQGGPSDLLQNPQNYLETAPFIRPMESPAEGCIEFIDTRAVGECVVQLGGGRIHVEDRIDHRVGLSRICNVGDMVAKDQPLAVIHAANEADWLAAADALSSAITVGRKTDPLPAIYEQF
jgi:thymidine phosphorylase